MQQRTSAEFSDLTDTLIHDMERGGYAVSVFRMGDYVELHAVQLKLPRAQHIARVADGDADEHLHRWALELARTMGDAV
jgi:hypothetical protein